MIKRVVHIAENQEAARRWDIRQALEMTPEERQKVARALKVRVYGEDVPDLRQDNLAREPETHFSGDILQFLKLLYHHDVQYVIVGGEAVIYYGYPRLTGDVDLLFQNSEDNIAALYQALRKFWDGDVPGIEHDEELGRDGYVIQFGVPPNRIDMMNSIEGVSFEEVWKGRKEEQFSAGDERILISYIGLKELIVNKRNTGRPKDLEDLNYLRELQG